MAYNSTISLSKQQAINQLKERRLNYVVQRQNAIIQKQQQEQQRLNALAERNKESNAGFIEKIFDTAGDFSGQVVSGLVKGLEGIYDFGASIVGGIGGIFSDDFQDSVKEHISYDFTGNHVSSHFNEWFSDSYLNDMGKAGDIIQGVANGIGQMLPAVIVTVATGGAGAPAAVSQIASLATVGVSAAGNSTEQAFNDGAGYGQGMAYGIANGLVEVATEKIGGKLFGNSAIDDALGLKPSTKTLFKTAKSTAGKFVQDAIGEGIEEGMAELVNPLTKTIYKGTDALNEYKDKEFWGRVGESAVIGAGTSIAYGGTLGRINRNTHNANETLSELRTLEVKEDNLHAQGKLFEGGNEQKINNLRTELRTQLSQDVSKMSEKTRAKYIAQNNLGDILNADGSLKTTATNSAQNIETTSKGGKNGLASVSNKEAYSPRFFGSENNLLIKPTTKQLTTSNRDAVLRINKLNKGYNRVGFAIVDDGSIKKLTGQDAKAIEHKGVIYIEHGADVESSQKVLATHELNHTLEGTKQKAKFDEFVIKSLLENETLAKRFGDYNSKFLETFNRYRQVFTEKYGDVSKATSEDIAMMMQETDNEVISQYVSETMFTDEATIERLASTDESIFKKIYNWIKGKVERFKIKSAEDRQVYDFLHKAESLYKKALENSVGGSNSVRYSIDKNEKKSYSKSSRKVAKYIPYSKVGNENITHIKRELSKIYNGFDDCVADGIAIENGNTIYVVDSGKENGELRFGIRNTIKISDETLRKERMVKINDRAIQDGFISEQLSGKIRGSSDKYSRGSIGRQLQEELSVDSRESTNNKERISKQDADRRGIKYSLDKTIKGVDEKSIPSKLQNAIVDYIVKDSESNLKAIRESIISNQQNIEKAKQKGLPQNVITNLEKHLEELKNEERQSIARQKGTKQVQQSRNVNVGENSEWNISDSYTERVRAIQEDYGLNENKESVGFLVEVINHAKLYKEYAMAHIVSHGDSLPQTIKIVDSESLPKQLQDIRNENSELGIRSWFFVNDNGEFDMDGFLATGDYNNRIFIVLDESNPNIIAINRHERTHYFQYNYPEEYKAFEKKIESLMTKAEKDALYDKYFEIYKDTYQAASIKNFEQKIWNEVYAQIYALNEKIKNYNAMYNTIDEFEESIKKATGLKDIKFSLSKDSNNNALTEAQAEFFKDSQVRDENGNLLVVYHGTDADFSVFDKSKSVEGNNAFWFSKSKEYAQEMAFVKNGKRVESFYLNMKEPLVVKMPIKDFADNVKEYKYIKDALEKNKDGVIFEEDSKDGDTFYAVFNANQIKSTTNLRPTLNNDIRFSLSNSVEEDVLKEFGKTYDWRETGYILKDGSKLDLSGKKHGSRGGSRSIDHREIFDIYEDADTYGTEAMIEFMGMGNIRVSPEYPGINIQIEPTTEQYEQIESMVDRLGWQNKAFIVDIDNHLGETIETMEYEGAVSGRKIVADIKYYFKEGKTPYKSDLAQFRFSLSKGQVAKDRANNSKMKVYSKIEAEKLINEIVAEKLNIGDKFGTLRGKSKAQAINQMFIALNSADAGYRVGLAQNIADYIIENAIYEDMYDDGMSEDALFRYNAIKEFRGKLNLSSIKSEIHHKFDTRPGNAIMMQWGTTKGGQGVDTVAQELQEFGIRIDAINEADIFFEMLDIYNDARDTLNKKAQKIRADYFNSGELKTLKNELVRDILKGYDKYGTESKFSNLIRKYVDRIALLKETIKDLKNRNKAINSLFATIDKVNGLEKFKSADIELSHEVLGLIKLLKGVKTYRNNLSKNVREIMIKYSQEVDGKKLYDLVANNGDGIENPVAKMVEDIAHGNGELTTNEIRQLDDIMKNFIHNVKEYNRVFFEGKTQNDEVIVRQAIKETQEAVALKNNGFLGSMSKFTRWLTAPVWRFERLSSYRQDGVMTKIFSELQKGVDNQARFNMIVAEHFNKFFKENKKIVSDWNKQTFDLNGTKLSRGQVITLYMLFQRKQAVGHLLSNDGVTGTIRIANEKHASKGNFKDALAEGVDIQIDYTTLDKIKDSLTDVEKEFIKLSKEFFDKISKDAKYETDMALYGISNVGEENYIPIRVADDQIYKQLGSNEISFSELFSVYNASFNKETKPNAKNKIVVENILDVINRHSKQMASYYGLAVPLKTLNRLYNKKLDDGSKLSIEINKVDPEFERYISKLLGDLQGRGNPRTTFDKVVGKIRSLGAKAALGLNLKVLANQFVSLPASHAVGVEYKNIMKGFAQATAKKTDFDKLTQYCPMLYDRFREGSNIDVGLLKENQGLFGKIDTLTELTTAPIGKIDKFICGAVWNSCLEQTKDSSKYDNYSDEHYKEAAKLTEKAVIKTQANYTALYRPAILREQNSFLQLSTMFMSEPLQQLSLLASSIDKIYVAKKLIKQNNSAENQALLKQAKTEAKAAITAVMVDAMLLTLIAQAFKWLKGQDDEEDIMTSMTNEFTSNFIGMFPFIKDLYTLYQGYDVTNMAYTGLTNVYNAFTEMYNIVDLVVSGEQYSETEIRGKLRKVLLGLSQTFGIPLRNLETYTKGIIEKVAPASVYRYESLFYNSTMSNYSKELKKAIENDDDALADTIIDVMLADEKVEVKDEKIRTTMRKLFEEGYDVFPKSVGETIIHDGESIKLTKRQHTKFREIYGQANDKVSSLINSKSFEDVPSVVKAKSIKYIYDYYYEEALKDLLGIDSDEKKYLFAQAIDITKLAMIVSQVSQVVADTDKEGNTISGSRKAKIVSIINSMQLTATQKYMLMGYFGYKNANGERQVKTYIQSLKLTKTEKETLFKMCGY